MKSNPDLPGPPVAPPREPGDGSSGDAGRLHFWRAPKLAEIEQAEAAERAGAGKP